MYNEKQIVYELFLVKNLLLIFCLVCWQTIRNKPLKI